MTAFTSVADVRSSLNERREIALIDVREEGVFAQSHPLFAASFPLGRLELEVLTRIPRRTVPIVVYDAGEGLAQKAVARLRDLGYTDVSLLEGGLRAWQAAGAELFRDVNVPSKAFGELVEARRRTPSIAADELYGKLESGADLVVLDARRFDEYHLMSIPSATSVPGGELVLRVRDLAPSPDSLVVVNCAGRTRSIIGTQSLINAGIPNRVVALRNGTIGWTLAGLPLEHAQVRTPAARAEPARGDTVRAARALAERVGVSPVSWHGLSRWAADPTLTLYRFDVRTPEEYAAGHLPGFDSAPGGQLVQETDVFAPVRGARVVLVDHDGVRAHMAASWLAQMGWEVSVLGAPDDVRLETGPGVIRLPPLPAVAEISARELADLAQATPPWIVDVSSSTDYARGHVPDAVFALRSRLEEVLAVAPANTPIVLVSADGVLASFAASDLEVLSGRRPWVLTGGTRAWSAAGFDLEAGLTHCLAPPIDRYKRPYEGTDNPQEAMQGYLDWEFGLVAQLERDGTHHFRVI